MNTQGTAEAMLDKYRKEFPVTERYVYLDHAGIAPVSRRVRQAVEEFIADSANSGAFHYGRWSEQVEKIRTRCAELIGARSDEIAFVKNTSHGLSLVAEGLEWRAGDNLLIYEKEFPSNIFPWIHLQRKGVEIRMIPFRDGSISFPDIETRIDSRTRLISISSVQFLNGFKIDLDRLGERCKPRGVSVCIDAIQSLGAFPLDVKRSGIDFLAADGHKWLLSPEGTGIFYCSRELTERLNPPLIGWKSVQHELDFDSPVFQLKKGAKRFEEGSLNVMGIIALGASLDLLLEVGMKNITERILRLGDVAIEAVMKRGFALKTPGDRSVRGGIISFQGAFDPFAVKEKLKERGIMINVRGGAIRLSPHFYNREEDIEHCFSALEEHS